VEAIQDGVYVSQKGAQKWAKTKTDVKFGNTKNFYEKFHTRIEKNYENIVEATQNEVCAPSKGVKNVLK